MSAKHQKIKSQQLGMAISTARSRLYKSLIFNLIAELGKNICFRCDKPIHTEDVFSVDHKKPWLYSENPEQLFFDLNNIGFSHTNCNSGAARCKSVVRSKSGFKGVYIANDRNRKEKFKATLRVISQGKNHTKTLGYYLTAEAAAIAYDDAALKAWGERAVTNRMLGLIKDK